MGCRCTRGAAGSSPCSLDALTCSLSSRGPAVAMDVSTVDRAVCHRAPIGERTGNHVLAPKVGCLPTGSSSEEAVMQSARNTLPTRPANDLTCGIDWARDDHAVCVARGSVPRSHQGRSASSSTGAVSHPHVVTVRIEEPEIMETPRPQPQRFDVGDS